MKTLTRMLSVIFALALLGALGGGGYFALKAIVKHSARLDFQVAAVTTIAALVALLAALIIASSIRQAGSQRQAPQARAEQAATYQFFIDLWTIVLRQGRPSDEQSAAKLSAQFQQLDCLLALYGSPTAVKAHTELCVLERKSGTPPSDLRSQFAAAVMEIRKELGADTRGLTTDELERLLCANTGGAGVSAKTKVFQESLPRASLASRA